MEEIFDAIIVYQDGETEQASGASLLELATWVGSKIKDREYKHAIIQKRGVKGNGSQA